MGTTRFTRRFWRRVAGIMAALALPLALVGVNMTSAMADQPQAEGGDPFYTAATSCQSDGIDAYVEATEAKGDRDWKIEEYNNTSSAPVDSQSFSDQWSQTILFDKEGVETFHYTVVESGEIIYTSETFSVKEICGGTPTDPPAVNPENINFSVVDVRCFDYMTAPSTLLYSVVADAEPPYETYVVNYSTVDGYLDRIPFDNSGDPLRNNNGFGGVYLVDAQEANAKVYFKVVLWPDLSQPPTKTLFTSEQFDSSYCLPEEPTDTDGDGVPDNEDAFPNDPDESTDSDGDGVGDNGDAFPNDPNESTDSDGDGVGDNADECTNQAGPASNNGCPEAEEPTDPTPTPTDPPTTDEPTDEPTDSDGDNGSTDNPGNGDDGDADDTTDVPDSDDKSDNKDGSGDKPDDSKDQKSDNSGDSSDGTNSDDSDNSSSDKDSSDKKSTDNSSNTSTDDDPATPAVVQTDGWEADSQSDTMLLAGSFVLIGLGLLCGVTIFMVLRPQRRH